MWYVHIYQVYYMYLLSLFLALILSLSLSLMVQSRAVMKQLNHNVALRVKLTQDLDTARETIQHLQVSPLPSLP